jgi:hypothetical protein
VPNKSSIEPSRKDKRAIRNGLAAFLVVTSLHSFSTLAAKGQCAAHWTTENVAGLSGGIYAIRGLANGDLIVAGSFTTAGGLPVNSIARYNPEMHSWSDLGSGITSGTVVDFGVLANGDIVAGGSFRIVGDAGRGSIGRWSSSRGSWVAMGTGTDAPVSGIAVLSNGNVMAVGLFQCAGSSCSANGVAVWNESTDTWMGIGSPLTGGTIGGVGKVLTMAPLPSGDVIMGGNFTAANSAPVNHTVRWNAASNTWSPLGGGTDGNVNSLLLLPNGDLLVSGSFTHAGGVAASRIARWHLNTGTWSSVGAGLNAPVNAMALLPNGDVLLDGHFTTAGGVSVSQFARLNPNTGVWSQALGQVTPSTLVVGPLFPIPDGDVFLGGQVAPQFTATSPFFATWTTRPACAADFNCSGGLSTQDIFDFLNAWFANNPSADFNGNGLDLSDIIDFISAWFTGC